MPDQYSSHLNLPVEMAPYLSITRIDHLLDFDVRKSRIKVLTVISQTAEYALRSVVYLGSQVGQPVTTQRIAAATRVPAGYLSKVLQALGKAGLVDAQRGLKGGYALARPLDELTVLDVINAVDPLERITRCPLGLAAHQGSLCSLHRRLDQAIALIEALYRQTTVEELLSEQGRGHSPLCEPVVGGEAAELEAEKHAAS
jgi:Rrf2 family transcriptional regulator, nitric oxide-sensitive transcriptional repressor